MKQEKSERTRLNNLLNKYYIRHYLPREPSVEPMAEGKPYPHNPLRCLYYPNDGYDYEQHIK